LVLTIILVGAVAALSQAFVAHADTAGPPAITDYVARAGDQVVTVPNGTYSGGTVSAPHPATDGPYRGWLVLEAQSPHGVVVDLSANPLVLEAGTSRVLFVGFKFVNGTIDVRGDDITFWYTEHTFPIEEWNRQFQAAGGNADALRTMINAIPTPIWVGDQTQGRTLERIQILGGDIHDAGDDGLYLDKSQDGRVQGVRIWNVEKKTYDPGYNPWIPSIHELIHNDGIQIPGAVYNLVVADSYVGQTITVGGDNAPAENLHWDNLWLSRADGVGLDFYSQRGFQVTGSMSDIRAWSEGFTQRPYDPGWDQLRVDIVDNRQVTWPNSLDNPRITLTSSGTNLNQCPPPGIAMSGGRMLDQSQALDNPFDPANVWRAAHPYDSWPTLFSTGIAAPLPTVALSPCATPGPSTPQSAPSTGAPQALNPTVSPKRTTTTSSHTTTTSSHPTTSSPHGALAGPPAAAHKAATGRAVLLLYSLGALGLVGVGALLLLRRLQRRLHD
jgi:hypothetical protein